MLGVQDQRHVQGPHVVRPRFLAAEHPEEVGGVAQVRAGGHGFHASAQTVLGRHGRRDLGRQPFGLAQVGLVRAFLGLRVVVGQDADRGAQHVHRVDGGRQDAQQVEQGVRQTAGGRQASLEAGELEAVRQLAVEQQERHLIEARVFHQFADRVAAVAQPAFDSGNGRFTGDDPLQAGGINRLAHVILPGVRFSERRGVSPPCSVVPFHTAFRTAFHTAG